MPTNYADIAAKHGGVPDTPAGVAVGAFDNPQSTNNGPDPKLTAETQLALERSPWAIRKHTPIQDVKVYDADLPNGETSLVDGRTPIAGVQEGDTSGRINAYQPDVFGGSAELAVHETTHFIDNRRPAAQQNSIPAGNPSDPYAELRLSLGDLLTLRAKGDTLNKHSREGRATIIQMYQAMKDRFAKMSPQDRADFMASTGRFKGAGNAEWEKAYRPYLQDEAALKLPGDKVVQQTAMKPPPLLLPSAK
jgi:hypothetical protein